MTTWRLPRLHPARALLTPTWLAALAVLALNDHLFKGSGLLPGGVTGKLSDFAGMIVAPALLAALIGVRSRRGLLLCHLAIGSVFAAINLSPAAADAWAWLMGLVFPWRITVDPTDLVALPALALGWRLLVPAMQRPLPDLALPRLARSTAMLAGTFLCVATSPPPRGDDDGGEWDTGLTTGDINYQPFDGDVYVHNGTDHDITVRTRELLSDVQLDCLAVEENPGLLLSEPLFGEGRTWTMPPSTNAPVRELTTARACYAVRVEGDAFAEPFVLFWQASDIGVQSILGDIDDPALHTPGAVLLADDADDRLVVQEARSEVVFAIDTIPPADAVYPGDDATRLAWSDVPYGEHEILTTDLGPDGCVAVEFAGVQSRWYLCVPPGAFPFAADEWVRIDDHFGALEIARIPDPLDPIAVPTTRLTVSRGETLPQIDDVVLAAKADYSVPIAPELICGTAARPNEVSVRYMGGDAETLRPGEQTTIAGQDTELTLWVPFAEDRVILDPTCAEGPDTLGPDIELAALVVPVAP